MRPAGTATTERSESSVRAGRWRPASGSGGGGGGAEDFEEVDDVELGSRRGRLLVGFFQSQEHLFTVHLDITRSVDAKPDMIAADLQHRYDDVMSDHDALIGVAS